MRTREPGNEHLHKNPNHRNAFQKTCTCAQNLESYDFISVVEAKTGGRRFQLHFLTAADSESVPEANHTFQRHVPKMLPVFGKASQV